MTSDRSDPTVPTFADWRGVFPGRIETDRLVLERLSPDAVDTFAYRDSVWCGPAAADVFEHVLQDPDPTPKTVLDHLRTMADRFDEGTAAGWVVRPAPGEAGTGEPAGLATLRPNWEARTAELGVILARPFWGRGYAGERARALAMLAFDQLDLDRVVVHTRVENDRSRRAIERYLAELGGERDGLVRNREPGDDGVHDVYRYSISRESWNCR